MMKFNYIYFVVIVFFSNAIYSQPTITDRNIKNCITFANVYGYAKYYYPIKKIPYPSYWEDVVIDGVGKVYDCNSDSELIDSLQQLFSCLAPEIIFTKKDCVITDKLNGRDKYFYNEYEGFKGKINSSSRILSLLIKITQPYKASIKHGKIDVDNKYFYTTYGNIKINVPYGLRKKHKIKCSEKKHQFSKRNQNIGATIIAWNIYKHFYPYQENVKSNWYNTLEKSIKVAESDTSDYKVLEALKLMSSVINDGHAKVFYRKDTMYYQPPFTIKIIGESIFVDRISSELEGEIYSGDEIVEIDHKPPKQIVDSLKNLISSSTKQWTELRVEQEILKGSKNSKLHIVYKKDNQLQEKRIIRNKKNNSWTYYNEEPIKMIEDSIYYINVETLTYSDFKKNIQELNTSKGVIIDFRGYPKSVNILKHFKDTTLKSPYWKVPYRTLFSIDKDIYTSRGPATRWTISPSKKQINVPVVFLTDANAISFSETCLDMVKYYKLGTVIGQPTAGSNGNVTGFWIYNKYYAIFTGMKVINNDGKPITDEGVVPDITVPITQEGLKSSKDEILLYGIEYIKALNRDILNK